MMTMVEILREHVSASPSAPCLTLEDRTLTFGEVEHGTNRVANALLAANVQAGDRVAVLSQACPEIFELAFGTAKAGAILLPLNWRLSAGEIAAILEDAAPALLIVEAGLEHLLVEAPRQIPQLGLTDYPVWRDAAPASRGPVEPAGRDPALLLYTSGTTGIPKGVIISHQALAGNARTARDAWGFTARSVNLVAMPLFHIGGIGYGMMALSQGGHTVILRQPDPATVVAAMGRHKVTHAFFVPTVIQRLIDHLGGKPMPDCTLERLAYGAAPIGEALLTKAIEVFGCRFNHAYGMTETAGTVITLPPEDHDPHGPHPERLRSCGRALPWAEVRIVDPDTGHEAPVGKVGEIRVRSPMVMLGYWRKPAATAEVLTAEGWLRTGDAAYRDADGYIFIQDRYKDMIVSGAENIYPAEIENVLQFHPDVAEVAVIGIPHPEWGETPRAYVIRRGAARPTKRELIDFVRQRLARYKAPSSVVFVEALPRNTSGKILKHELRRLATSHVDAKGLSS